MQLPLPIEGETIELPLTQGKVAIVDAIDGDLAALKWYVLAHKKYAVRWTSRPNRKMIYLHRVILSRTLGRELEPNEFPDHIDGNGLNCTRSNLRLATNAENMHNAKKRKDNTSGYKGVCFIKTTNQWRASIHINHRTKNLGHFDTPEEAYEVYCKAAKEAFGEFARFE